MLELFSLYIHSLILKKLELSNLCRKQVMKALKLPKICYIQGRIFEYKEIFFFYLTLLNQSVLSYKRFKNKHFFGQIDNFMTSISIFNLDT